MAKKNIPAFSSKTNTTYDSWDDLVAAEADGYAVIIVGIRARTGKVEFANIFGKRDTQKAARNLAASARRVEKREGRSDFVYKFFVRPDWRK